MKKLFFIIGLVGFGVFAGAQNNINQYEYWFDSDYAGRVVTDVTPTPQFMLNTAVSADNLEDGLHTFHIRFRDDSLNFSPVVSRFFQKVSPGGTGDNAIAGFEYWFDDGYANRVSQMITPQTLYELNTAINADTLTNGLHTFHSRFVDTEGNWSPVVSRFFQKVSPGVTGGNAITGFEYWFDDGYANKVSQTVTPQGLYELNTAINADTLANGLHTFHSRFVDSEGNWSPVVSRFFQKVSPGATGGNAIVGFEYWFDDDYAGKVYQAVTPQTMYELNTAINADTLANGLHTFHSRFVDAEGNWSPVVSRFFQKVSPGAMGGNAIAGFEYWFDDDYAGKVYQTITPQALYELNMVINADTLANGLHTFHSRFVDTKGNWSSVVSRFFQKVSPGPAGSNVIAGFEYWFDDDYAGKVYQAVGAQGLYPLDTVIAAGQLDVGLHTFHIRFQDVSGNWSGTVSQFFQKISEGAVTPNAISVYRYWFDNDTNTVASHVLNPPSNPMELVGNLNVSQVDTGEHRIHFQFQDMRGQWSRVVTDTIVKLGEPRLDNITPDIGGNTGTVTVNLYGTGFYTGTTVRLVDPGIDTISAISNSIVIIKGQRIQATLNLEDRNLGIYDVEVIIPGGIVLKLIDGFEVVEGIPVQLWSTIQGSDRIRPGRWQNFTVIVGNNGNVDATGVPFWISTPQDVEVDFDFPITNPYGNAYDYDTISNTFLTDTVWMMPSQSKMSAFVVSKIPPNQSRTFNFKIKTTSTSNFEIQSWVNKPLYNELRVLDFDPSECLKTLLEEAILEEVTIQAECLYSATDAIVTIWKDSPWGDVIIGQGTSNPDYGSIEYILNYSRSLASMALTCVDAAFGGAVGNLEKAIFLAQTTNSIIDISQDCSGTVSTIFQVIRNDLTVVNSYDPNDKIGPSGGGSENFYNDLNPYNYVIHFENVDTATAKAQSVLVLDTLDASVFDFETFQLGDLQIGDTVLIVPPGRKDYQVFYNMITAQNVVVKITAHFNDTTGVASWLFESLDPQTLMPVANPLDGFLPPNQTAPEGEGAVHYSIRLKENLPNNTLIKNKASIYFDNNPPLATEEWQNTLDNIRPHSQVEQVSAIGLDTLFNVAWNGVDTSSGIRYYSIYVSTNGGAYRPWLINTDLTSATFTGEADSVYCFYSIATDWAGNVEAAPLSPDACISSAGNRVSPIAFLQGAYDSTAGLMRDNLRANGELPLTEPYTALGYTHIGGGGENAVQEVLDISDANAIVDWLFLELRDGADSTLVLATRSALLQRDGDVVDTDGISPVAFPDLPEGEYYMTIKHRNHLGVMSAAPIALSAEASVVDFTEDSNTAFGGINGIAALDDGQFGLYSGDFNDNGQVQNTDYSFMVLTLGTAGYLQGDLDLNGQVQNVDVQFHLVPNIGRGEAFPE